MQSRPFRPFAKFAVRCSRCSKWRLVPTRAIYEEIRESVEDVYFLCEDALSWQLEVSCEHPTDLSEDEIIFNWAIEKPGIPPTPLGWQRVVQIRTEGGNRFTDVYYSSPSGRRQSSMAEIERYLTQNPNYIREGVNLSQFSFEKPIQIPQVYCATSLSGPSTYSTVAISNLGVVGRNLPHTRDG